MILLNNNHIIHCRFIKSTNGEAERLLAIGEDAPFAVLQITKPKEEGDMGRCAQEWKYKSFICV